MTGFVTLTHGSRHAPDPVLGRGRPSACSARSARSPLDASGHLQRHDGRRRRRRVSRYRYPTRGDTSYPGPEVVYRVQITKPRRELRRRRPLRPRRPARGLRGRREPPGRLPGPARSSSTRTSTPSARAAPVAGAVLPAAGHLRHRLRHRGRQVARRPVQVPLLGERHDAADAAARCPATPGRSPSRSPTPARASTRARSRPPSTAATVRVHFADGKVVIAAPTPASHQLVVTASDYQEAEEHGGRREDQAEHGDARAHRARQVGPRRPPERG